jgi:hypothetical protein
MDGTYIYSTLILVHFFLDADVAVFPSVDDSSQLMTLVRKEQW